MRAHMARKGFDQKTSQIDNPYLFCRVA